MLRKAAPYIFSVIALLLIFEIYYRLDVSLAGALSPTKQHASPSFEVTPSQLSEAVEPPEVTRLPDFGQPKESNVELFAESQLFKSIDDLIQNADTHFENLVSRQSNTLEHAAQKYRERRRRHPPPGFNAWFEYAHEHNAVIVEEFWDQIYHDLDPFWAVSPATIRVQARKAEMSVLVEDGVASTKTDWFWHLIWQKMIHEVAHILPDMVIPLNPMDEPRMLVPFADINAAISVMVREKAMPPAQDVIQQTQSWREYGEDSVEAPEVKWLEQVSPYSWIRAACDPQSPIHADMNLQRNSEARENHLRSQKRLIFVKNSTTASDTCSDPKIATYHAAVITPLSTKSSQTLQPMFGGSKLSVNNDILLPAPMYWNGEDRFEQTDFTDWNYKLDSVMWRGTATGGRHNAFNWFYFHRLRFVALTNGTKYTVSDAVYDKLFPPTEQQLTTDMLPLSIQRNLKQYLSTTNNVGFTDLFCDVPGPNGTCWYLDDEFAVAQLAGLSEQYKNKIIPDIDGNSFSGRYRSFLLSKSLPFKATLFREWHDSRLLAWKHYVPMSNKFTEYYSLLAYFLGCSEEVCGVSGAFPSHDKEGEAIATAGSEWAQKVLRKEDMHIYIGRLLLEYSRITDDNRMKTGWVDDLLLRSSSNTPSSPHEMNSHETNSNEEDTNSDLAT